MSGGWRALHRPGTRIGQAPRTMTELSPFRTPPSPAAVDVRRSALRIQTVEEAGVLLVDHVALDLERRRQLAGLLREVVVEDRELLDLLDLRVVAVDVVEDRLDALVDLRVLGELGGVGVLDAELL